LCFVFDFCPTKLAAPIEHKPNMLAFSFQFFNLPLTETTGVYPIKKAADTKDTMYILSPNFAASGINGLVKRFSVSNMELAPNEYTYFTKYLHTSSMFIHVYDAEKRMKIGSVCIPLNYLNRHEMQSGVSCIREFDIIEKLEDMMTRDSRDYSAKRRGKLHMRLANIGKQSCK